VRQAVFCALPIEHRARRLVTRRRDSQDFLGALTGREHQAQRPRQIAIDVKNLEPIPQRLDLDWRQEPIARVDHAIGYRDSGDRVALNPHRAPASLRV
jgi:hypothetical protein